MLRRADHQGQRRRRNLARPPTMSRSPWKPKENTIWYLGAVHTHTVHCTLRWLLYVRASAEMRLRRHSRSQ